MNSFIGKRAFWGVCESCIYVASVSQYWKSLPRNFFSLSPDQKLHRVGTKLYVLWGNVVEPIKLCNWFKCALRFYDKCDHFLYE